ncbi:hypothetical protein, partial [Streptomyces sp. WAC02707]|uniref:hypothetical protein n=1 Tax=Streptomyces sp. WAC02707 TaxID=2487417 RepID=UPI00163C3775
DYPDIEAVWRDFRRACRKTVQQIPELGMKNAVWDKGGIQETAFWKFSRSQEFAGLLAERLSVQAGSGRAGELEAQMALLITAMVGETVARWMPPMPKENKGGYRRHERRAHLGESVVEGSRATVPQEKVVTFSSKSEYRFYDYTGVDYSDALRPENPYIATKPWDGHLVSPPDVINQDLVATYGTPMEFASREGFGWVDYLDYDNSLLSRHDWWVEAENDLISAFKVSANQPFLDNDYIKECILHYLGSRSAAWKPDSVGEEITPLGFLEQHAFAMFTDNEFNQIRSLGIESDVNEGSAEESIRYLSYAVMTELRNYFCQPSGGFGEQDPGSSREAAESKRAKTMHRRQLRDRVISSTRKKLQDDVYRDHGYGR